MWRTPSRSEAGHQKLRRPAGDAPDDPPAGPARATPRSRAAIEEDLRGLSALRLGVRRGDIRADRMFGEIIARRADRLLDEWAGLPDAPVHEADSPPPVGRADHS